MYFSNLREDLFFSKRVHAPDKEHEAIIDSMFDYFQILHQYLMFYENQLHQFHL